MRGRGRYAAFALGIVVACAGCGTGSPISPPAGIDELTIPTPSPDAADFVRGVDNPWLALVPGRTSTFLVTGAVEGRLVVSVEDTTYEIAGVATTPVSRTDVDGTQVVDYFAQDRSGNVWWFGREGVWLAGRDGAQAGLAMPADPRHGDGWREAYAPGVVDVRAMVSTTDQTVTTAQDLFHGALSLDVTDEIGDTSKRIFYVRGTGLVEEVSTTGPVELAELESTTG